MANRTPTRREAPRTATLVPETDIRARIDHLRATLGDIREITARLTKELEELEATFQRAASAPAADITRTDAQIVALGTAQQSA